jgi:hypothetical protein
VERLVGLSEDLQAIAHLVGFNELIKKLKFGSYEHNVDLEVAIAAAISRLSSVVELEPSVTGSLKKPDCRFKASTSSPWVYVEATRKMSSTVQQLIDSRGEELAHLAANTNPSRKCVVVLKREMDDQIFGAVKQWMLSGPEEGTLGDFAEFFTVSHTESEVERVLGMVQVPISVRSSGDVANGSFGVCYLHIPDKGAKSKVTDKQIQFPKSSENILFIDITRIHEGFECWAQQIQFDADSNHLSAIVLVKREASSAGLVWKTRVVANPNSTNVLSEHTETLLQKLCQSFETPLSLFR